MQFMFLSFRYSIRQYAVVEHTDLASEKTFSGEVARLGSFRNQKP